MEVVLSLSNVLFQRYAPPYHFGSTSLAEHFSKTIRDMQLLPTPLDSAYFGLLFV